MMLDVGKTYDFFYATADAHWSLRGEVVEIEGVIVKIKGDHDQEEIVNLGHIFMQCAKEFDIAKFDDLPDYLKPQQAPIGF